MSAHWDSEYESGGYSKRWDYAIPSQELVAVVAALGIPPEGTSLDVGCGAGREAVFLALSGFRSIGVDWSEKALVIARERARAAGVEVDFRHGSALALPVEDGSIDLANDRGCFHHIEEKDRRRYAEELFRVLAPGGVLLLRGCRELASPPFVPITQEAVDRFFAPTFSRGPVLPIRLQSDSGSLEANVVVLRKRPRP